ncbi:MAG: hypothetical protein JXA21_00985 [Anaerolineae bacterium]|nr:hypothetical protein [Anaerolineae bacterium]
MGGDTTDLFINRDRELKGFCKLLRPETPQAVMLVEAGELMGKTCLIGQMFKRCFEEAEKPLVVTVDFKDERERHAVQDALSLARLIQEKSGYPQYFTHLDDVIANFAVIRRSAGLSALMPLIAKIEATYDLERLERLAMWLDIKWENLSGDTLFQKAKGLVMHFQNLGDFSKLFGQLEQERPQVDWRKDFGSLLAEPVRAATGASFDRTAEISLPVEGRDLAEAQINRAFAVCLEKLLVDVKPVVFLFDGCEEAPDEAEKWIREQFIDRLLEGELKGVVVIFAARKVPYRLDIGDKPVAVKTGLDGFDEERARAFFTVHGVQVDPAVLPMLVASSGGQPGMLARMVDNLRAKKDKEDPFFQ